MAKVTDHMPECPVPHMDGLWGLPLHPEDAESNCICDRLRACESRIRSGYADTYAEGIAAGLDAAREAVESAWTLDPSWDGTNWNNALHEALAAIDALREAGSGNPDNPPSAGKPDKPIDILLSEQ